MNFILAEEERRDLTRFTNRIFQIWNYFQLLPYLKLRENRFVQQRRDFRVVLALILFSFSIYILIKNFLKISVYFDVIYMFLINLNCFAFLGVLILHTAQDEIVKITSEIQEIQNIFTLNGFRTKTRSIFLNTFWMLSLVILANLFSLAVTLFYYSYGNHGAECFLFTYSAHTVDMQVQLLYSSWFSIANNFLDIVSRNPEQNTDLLNSMKLYRLPDKIRSLYDKYCALFSKLTFMRIWLLGFNFLLCIYTLLTFLELYENYKTPETYFLGLVNCFCWCSLVVWNCLHNIGLPEQAYSKSKLAVENIHDIQMRIGRQNLPYKSMELFLLKSKLNGVKFSVCGFYTLDWTLIYSMVAGVTTYLVYLVQFREMEQTQNRSIF